MTSSKKGEYRGKVVCHVDDSVWAGPGEDFKAAQQKVRDKLPFKHEKSGKFTVLGGLVEQFEDRVEVSQHEYLKNIKKVYVKKDRRRQPESPLTADGRAAFMSLVQQLAWPARCSCPQLAYDVNDSQQKTKEAKLKIWFI